MPDSRRARPGPIDPAYRAQMNALAETLDEVMNGIGCKPADKKIGFLLCMFEFGSAHPGARFNYISNADMLDVKATLADILARLEARSMPPGRA